jgi:hypothetical protein
MTVMHRFVIMLIVFIITGVPLLAMGPEYVSSKQWVINNAVKPSGSSEKMIYLGSIGAKGKQAVVVAYTSKISVKSLIELTQYKNKRALLIVLRKDNPIDPVFSAVIDAGEDKAFLFRPEDVVWVCDPSAPQ